MTFIDQPAQCGDELSDIIEMKTRRWFVENKEPVRFAGSLQVSGQFEALGFAA